MDWDDLKPKPPKLATLGENLETFSVAELQARIAALGAFLKRLINSEAPVARSRTC